MVNRSVEIEAVVRDANPISIRRTSPTGTCSVVACPAAFRASSEIIPGAQIRLESGHSYETIRELMKMGHKVGFSLGLYGGYQAIRYDPQRKVYYGASESRKDGQAAGY